MKKCCISSHKKQGIKDLFKYKYVGSVVNIRNKITENHNLDRLLKYFNNKVTVFKVTEIDQYIFESTLLYNQKIIDSIDECKVAITILNEPL